MSPESVLAIIGGIIIVISLVVVVIKKMPKRVQRHHYTRKWREVQSLCGKKDEWPQALKEADMILDEVLKKRRFAGKTMGERMVEAQKYFSSNDAVWNAHKLVGKVEQNGYKLKESDVKSALIAYRQALRDLGAL